MNRALTVARDPADTGEVTDSTFNPSVCTAGRRVDVGSAEAEVGAERPSIYALVRAPPPNEAGVQRCRGVASWAGAYRLLEVRRHRRKVENGNHVVAILIVRSRCRRHRLLEMRSNCGEVEDRDRSITVNIRAPDRARDETACRLGRVSRVLSELGAPGR